MARVTAYEASDGNLFRDRKDWLRHEANLVAHRKLVGILAAELPAGQGDAEAVLKLVRDVVGYNRLRELLNVPFKPVAEEGSDEADAQPGAAPQAAAQPAPQAQEMAPPVTQQQIDHAVRLSEIEELDII